MQRQHKVVLGKLYLPGFNPCSGMEVLLTHARPGMLILLQITTACKVVFKITIRQQENIT